jgi:hypothetical protein
MARDEAPPFERGATFYNGSVIDPNNLGGFQHEGKIWVFEDLVINAGVGAKPQRTNRPVRCMVVRNVSAGVILPKRLCKLQKSGAFFFGRVDGYSRLDADDNMFPADEFLPVAGVPINDLFWVVIDGPALVLTDLAGAANNVFNTGDPVVAMTAATSGATTAGRVKPQDLTGATAVLGGNVQNRLGFAITARTTGNTNADLLIDVRKW